MEEKRYRNLRIFNLVMAVLHAVQGGLMLYLSNDFALPITTGFLKFNPMVQQLIPVYETVWEVRIGPLVAIFLFLSAVAHLLVSLPGIYQWYVNNLKKGINKARWIEYSVSSSLMMVVIAMLVGMYDGVSLLLLLSVNACMILFGWVMEVHNQSTEKTNWTSYIFGCFAGLIPWVAVALYLVGSIEGDQGPPNFVYWIFFSIFLFFNIFAINMILQYKKIGPWKDYVFGEKVYIILSLVAKSVLAWQVFAGTLRPV
ncbi:heliorhodopsin HeR [Patescibacteria group bacterium]|nr:heliorhodopsin HeR [Patescibacteria group bacterium]